MADSPLVNSLLLVIQQFEQDHLDKIQRAEETVENLQAENDRLRQELDKGSSLLGDIADEGLRKRLVSLGSPPLDVLIREAGVVFEDRIRRIAGSTDKSLNGAQLVDAVLAPGKGTLTFSAHAGEQQGVHMLYRGAMQFIRNPPMHNLIEYQASTAQILLRLIDSLLRLLAEAQLPNHDEVKMEDVRTMLTRRPIQEAQRLLYHALYQAGDKGMTSSELAAALSRTRPQLSGVLGALGLRMNGTEGLENKGGVEAIFDVSRLTSGDYLYRMRPVLRKALELEKVI